MFAKKFVTGAVVGIISVLGLVGCGSAEGQSGTGEGQSPAGEAEPAAKTSAAETEAQTEKGTVTPEPLSLGAACNANCLSGFYRAESGCAGDQNCVACAENAEQACLARCAGRIPVWRPCEP